MSVIRVEHTTNYVVINKIVLEDPNLSFKAKGLWSYCMSRPNDWEFHVSHLATVSKDGEDAVYSAIKELEKFGYCKKIQKNEKGKFGSVDYIISETAEFKKSLPQPDFPDAGFPLAGNPALLSNDKELNIDNNKKRESTPTVFTEEGKVKMSVDAYANLVNEHGIQKIKEMIARLNEYADINPKRFKQYANHATVIRKWIREDKQKAPNLPQDQRSDVQIANDRESFGKVFNRAANGEIKLISDFKKSCLIELTKTGETINLHFGEPSTRECILQIARKLDLPISDI